MTRAALEAATPAPPRRALTENQIIEQVLFLADLSPAERAWHLRPDAPIRAAIRGEVPRESMAWPERKAAALSRRRGAEQ
jgi:hypothetical protein